MKRFKKLLSIIVVLSMMLQILPVFAQEVDIVDNGVISRPVNYIINDNFASTDADGSGFDGWSLNKTSEGVSITEDVTYVTTEPEYEGSDNYLLKYSSGSNTDSYNTFVRKTFDTPIVFEEGKDVVIETKVMQTKEGGRSFLKYNLIRDGSWNEYTAHTWGTLIENNKGAVNVPNGFNPSFTRVNVCSGANNKWFDIKITIHGNTKTATYEITDLSTSTVYPKVEKTSIAHDETAKWVENALNSLEFTLRDPQILYVDYIRVYEIKSADFTIEESYSKNSPITVEFSESDSAFKDAVVLYDSYGNKVDSVNSIDETGKIVTVAPIKPLNDDEIYTVGLDINFVPENYVFAKSQKKFIVSPIDYIIYDEFGSENDFEGWKFIGTSTDTHYAKITQDTEKSDNYWLEYSALSSEGFNGYVKRVLERPVVLDEGKDVVIETKIMQSNASGRSMLKYNLVRDGGWKEYNNGYGLLFDNDKGTFRAPNGSSTSVSASNVITDSTGEWLDIKITIHGNSKTATYEVKNLNKNTSDKMENRGIANPSTANWVEDALNSLEFTLKNGQTLYVDYVKVYEITDAQMIVEKSYKKNEPVTVKFDNFCENFVNAVALYDIEGNKIKAVNTIDMVNSAVVITPESVLEDNQKYIVKIDNELIPSNYVFAKTEESFIVSSNDYIIYDEFGSENNLEGWSFVGTPTETHYVKATVDSENPDNYVMEYSIDANTNGFNSYITRILPNAVTYTAGKDIIIETKIKQTEANGRSMLKHNLVRDDGWKEYNNGYGLLFDNDKGTFRAPNGSSTSVLASDVITDSTGDWLEIKITIHGNSKTATYEVKNLNKNTYDKMENRGIANPSTANWDETALKSLEFTLKNTPQTLYVDYVKVYVPEQKSLALNLANGRYVVYTDDIVFDVTTDEEELYIPDGTVVLKNSEGAEVITTLAYDETTKTLTLSPEGELAVGEIYTVAINENGFIKAAEGYATSFEIEAKDVYTEAYSVYDSFDNDTVSDGKTSSGWYLGTTKDGVGGTIAIVEEEGAKGKALKLSGEVMDATANGMQTILTKKLGGGFEYKENSTITVRTRFKYTGTGRIIFEENRPDTLNIPEYLLVNNYYNLFMHSTSGIYYQTGVTANSTGGTSPIFENDYTNQWIDITMVIDGYNQKMTITAKPENGEAVTKTGSTKRCDEVWKNHFGKKPVKNSFDALERLSFTYRQSGGDLYIDYVEVYEAPDVKAQLSEGRFVQYNKPVEIKLMSEKAIPEAVGKEFAKAVTIDGVETVNTYDESTQTVILSHSGLVSDKKYTVSVDSDVVSGIGVVYSGTTSWEIWARNERKTGKVINETFDSGLGSWSLGAAKSGKEGQVSYTTYDSKSVLELKSGALGVDNGNQSSVVSTLNGGIDFDSNKDIVIKTRFLHTNPNTRVYLDFNRPNTVNLPLWGTNTYTLLCVREGGNIGYPAGVSKEDTRQVAVKGMDNSGNYAGKWITAEIVIHGKGNGVSYKTSYVDDNGNTVVKTAEGSIASPADVYTHAYGAGTDKTTFDALENLTFTFRGNDGETDTLYVDYVEVYTRNTFKASVNFFGEDETSTTTITDGMKVVPVFDFYDESNGDYLAISVMYKNGKILDMHTMPVKAGYGVRVEDEGWVIADATNIVIKSFVWNSLDKLMPVSNVTSLAGDVAEPLKKIYVAENGDDDVAMGEKTSPVASISRAIEIAKNATESDEVEIIVEDGTYYLDKTISVNKTNHVTDKLTIKAAENAKPVIVNGKALKLSEAEKVTDSSILSRLAEEKAKDNLYQISLKGMDIPQINLPGAYSYAADGLQTATGTFRFEESKTATCEIFFDGQPMTVARYPNGEYLNVNNVIEEGSITRHWMSDAGGNLVPVNQRIATPFSITEPRATKWTTAKDALMFGYWKNDWATQTVPVANISGTTITSKYPSHYGVGVGQRYYVYNLLEEIDVPGEYYIDRDKEILYFMLPVGASTDGEDEFIISLNDFDMLNVSASNVIVDGLTFSATRNNAIELSGSNITVKNCEITNAAGTAVMISGTNNSIEGCNIHNVNGGISVNSGDSSTFTAGNNIISGNTISDYSRINKAYTFAVSLKGSGNKLTDNEIYNGEHTAVYFEGTNHVIEYNNIHDVCKEVDDAGAIYSNRSWVNRGNEIVYNYIHDIRPVVESKQGVAGIFLDDHFAGAYIKGNVFADITGCGIRTNQGRENVITNNIFVNCTSRGCSITSTNNPVASSYETQIKGVEKYLNNQLWRQEYPVLFATDNLGVPMVNTNELIYSKKNEYTKNLSVACSEGYNIGSYATANGTIENNKVVANDPGFTDMASKNYSILPDKTGIAGFEEIPFDRMR